VFRVVNKVLIQQKAGTLDDTSILDNFKVDAELFTGVRPKWVAPQESAAQKNTMS
jgi:hypothetical protein